MTKCRTIWRRRLSPRRMRSKKRGDFPEAAAAGIRTKKRIRQSTETVRYDKKEPGLLVDTNKEVSITDYFRY